MVDEPLRRGDGNTRIDVIGLGSEFFAPAGIKRHDIAGPDIGRALLEVSNIDDPAGFHIKMQNDTRAMQALQRKFVEGDRRCRNPRGIDVTPVRTIIEGAVTLIGSFGNVMKCSNRAPEDVRFAACRHSRDATDEPRTCRRRQFHCGQRLPSTPTSATRLALFAHRPVLALSRSRGIRFDRELHQFGNIRKCLDILNSVNDLVGLLGRKQESAFFWP